MSAFTREYVEELRREAQRKGARIRELAAELEARTAELEALRRGGGPHSRGYQPIGVEPPVIPTTGSVVKPARAHTE